MPVLKKNMRPFLYPKGARTAVGRYSLNTGLLAAAQIAADLAILEWKKEHGNDIPPADQWILMTVSYTTFEVLVEIVCEPDNG